VTRKCWTSDSNYIRTLETHSLRKPDFPKPAGIVSAISTAAMLRFCLLASATCASAAAILSKRAPENLPSFVLDYAPVVYLHSEDPYLPSDIGNQLANTEPRVNFTAIKDAPNPLTLDNLAELNDLGGKNVYLTSKIKPDENPEYLHGVLPNDKGETEGAVSTTVIVNDRGNDTVDVFYMYFYAFDYGGFYVGQDIGNHIGDWEHNMIRFKVSYSSS
jgi:hypothetical protein